MTEPQPRPSREGFTDWPPEAARRYIEAGYWAGRPLAGALREAATARGDRLAVSDGERRLSHAELSDRADGCAAGLLDLGLRPDDRIVVQLPNTLEFLILTYACFRIGVIPVMALPAHRRQEITHLARHAEARAIAVPARLKAFDHRAMAREVAAEVPTVRHLLVSGEPAEDTVELDALCARPGQPDDAARLDACTPDSRSIAVLLLSGGTTGLPKLITRTHDDYLYNIRRSAEVSGFGTDTVYYAALPMSHNFPLGCPGILGALLSGGRVVIGSPRPEAALAAIEVERVTVTSVVPAAAQRWLDLHRQRGDHDLSSLRVLQVGGARIADELARTIKPVLGCTLQQVFGMAEGLLNYTRLDDPDEAIWGTQGRPISPDDELIIVDQAGQPVPAGRPGVLLTRGPYTPRGYYLAPEINARSFTPDGWYRTGDVVRQRPDGNLVVEGRDKDMILRGGENISAEEVENLAYLHPGVLLCAAVAMPDRVLGERVCLYVVARPDRQVTLAEIHAAMDAAGVAKFKYPEHLVLVDDLATTKVGKIDKAALRADIAQRLQDNTAP